MFCKKNLAVDGYSSISEHGGHWRYVIDIIQHEKAEIPIRKDMEYWLRRFVHVAEFRQWFCSTKTIQLVG